MDREGTLLLISATDTAGTPHSPNGSDAWRGSIEIAIAKAYTALAFSSNQQALDSRTLGRLARLDAPSAGRRIRGRIRGRRCCSASATRTSIDP